MWISDYFKGIHEQIYLFYLNCIPSSLYFSRRIYWKETFRNIATLFFKFELRWHQLNERLKIYIFPPNRRRGAAVYIYSWQGDYMHNRIFVTDWEGVDRQNTRFIICANCGSCSLFFFSLNDSRLKYLTNKNEKQNINYLF